MAIEWSKTNEKQLYNRRLYDQNGDDFASLLTISRAKVADLKRPTETPKELRRSVIVKNLLEILEMELKTQICEAFESQILEKG